MKSNWEDNFDKEFDAMYKAGYGSDMRLIKDFIDQQISLAHEELIEKVKGMKFTGQVDTLYPNWESTLNAHLLIEKYNGYNAALDKVLDLLTPKE